MPRQSGEGKHLFENTDWIAKEALLRLYCRQLLGRISNRTYEKDFKNRVGDTITVKRPYYTSVQTGRVLKVAPLVDRTIQMKVNVRKNWSAELSDEEQTLHVNEFYSRYASSGVEELAFQYDIMGHEELQTKVGASIGTPGSALTAQGCHEAQAMADDLMIPESRRCLILPSAALPSIFADLIKPVTTATSTAQIFNPDMVQEMIASRFQGNLAGYMVYTTPNMPNYDVFATPSGATPLVNIFGGYEGDTLPTDGWGNSAADTKVMNKGQRFTIAGVYEKQPRGQRKILGNLKSFAAVEDVIANASGEADIKISPELNGGGLSIQGGGGGGEAAATIVLSDFANASSDAANNAVITLEGTSGRSYHQGVYFQSDTLEFANIQLATNVGIPYSSTITDDETGMAVRVQADGEIKTSVDTIRLDILFGVAAVYPELSIATTLQTIRSYA